MQKRWIVAGVVVLVVCSGYFGVKQYLSQKIGEEVVKLTEDKDIQKAIQDSIDKGGGNEKIGDITKQLTEQAANSPLAQAQIKQAEPHSQVQQQKESSDDVSQSSTEQGQSPSETADAAQNTPSQSTGNQSGLKNRDDAVKYAMSKFSASEIAHYTNVYRNKNNLTREQKDAIKAEILSRFTTGELSQLVTASSKH